MRIPDHIGIIPDGNRRWATGNGFDKQDGYNHGLNPGLEILKDAKQFNVKEITYYGFTKDNCKRPKEQIKAFSQACIDAVNIIKEYGDVALLVVGNTKSKFFPKELLPFTKRTVIGEDAIKVNFLVNYGWDWDLSNIKSPKELNKIEEHLFSKDISRIDMIIRWGGMRRLSGFLPVQSVYADFFVVEELWPDYEKKHLENALCWYQNQDVTLGG